MTRKNVGVFARLLACALCTAATFSTANAQVTVAQINALPDPAKPGGAQPKALSVPRPQIPNNDRNIESQPSDSPILSDSTTRFNVNQIVVEGVVERPDAGITAPAIQALLDEGRQARPDGFTLGELQQLANDLTRFYRQRGFLVARAVVPKQRIKAGVVHFRVVEGIVEKINIADTGRLSPIVLQKLTRALIGQPVEQRMLEAAMLHINDLPGLSASAVLSPGDATGTTQVALQILAQRNFEYAVNLDNYGSRYTGEGRIRGDVRINNPARRGDRLALTVLPSFSPSGSLYGQVNYDLPIMLPSARSPLDLRFMISKNSFDVGRELAELLIRGESERLELGLGYDILRSRRHTLSLRGDLARKDSSTSRLNERTSLDKLAVLTLGIDSNRLSAVDARRPYNNILQVSASHGFGDFLGSMAADDALESSRLTGSGKRVGAEFTKLNVDLTHYQILSPRVSLQARLSGQFSSDPLLSVEQYSLGGPDSIRAYSPSAALADKALLASLELAVDLPIRKLNSTRVQLLTFIDHGRGDLNDPLENETQSVSLTGAGIGIRALVGQWGNLTLTVGKPINDELSADEDDDVQVYFGFGLQL